VLYGLEGLARLRHGEAAGLRWKHIEPDKPLNRIVVVTSYDTNQTKTRVHRWMPVHPLLAAMLAEWKLQGWPREFGRKPEPEDLVVPHTRPTNRGPRVVFGGMRSDGDSGSACRKT
jgi:integrase